MYKLNSTTPFILLWTATVFPNCQRPAAHQSRRDMSGPVQGLEAFLDPSSPLPYPPFPSSPANPYEGVVGGPLSDLTRSPPGASKGVSACVVLKNTSHCSFSVFLICTYTMGLKPCQPLHTSPYLLVNNEHSPRHPETSKPIPYFVQCSTIQHYRLLLPIESYWSELDRVCPSSKACTQSTPVLRC